MYDKFDAQKMHTVGYFAEKHPFPVDKRYQKIFFVIQHIGIGMSRRDRRCFA